MAMAISFPRYTLSDLERFLTTGTATSCWTGYWSWPRRHRTAGLARAGMRAKRSGEHSM